MWTIGQQTTSKHQSDRRAIRRRNPVIGECRDDTVALVPRVCNRRIEAIPRTTQVTTHHGWATSSHQSPPGNIRSPPVETAALALPCLRRFHLKTSLPSKKQQGHLRGIAVRNVDIAPLGRTHPPGPFRNTLVGHAADHTALRLLPAIVRAHQECREDTAPCPPCR